MRTLHFLRIVFLLYAMSLTVGSVIAQQQTLHYWRKPDSLLQDQATLVFSQAHKILDKYPPSAVVGDERLLALYSIDVLLHDTRLDNTKAFLDYIGQRYDNVALRLQNEKPANNEIRIYRLYNHGFVLQSPTVTIGIDLIRGGSADRPFISDSLMRRLVERCDILFVSHIHGDHADKSVAQMFYEHNKFVITPPELWDNTSPNIKYLRAKEMVTETIRIPARNANLTVRVFPGHQDEIPNNIYAITTPENKTILHTGDQYNKEDMAWLAHVAEKVKVDVLLVHSWMGDLEQTVEGIRPSLIITGHENEMEHSIDHRESFWLTFRRFSNIKVPYVVMAWGEYYSVMNNE